MEPPVSAAATITPRTIFAYLHVHGSGLPARTDHGYPEEWMLESIERTVPRPHCPFDRWFRGNDQLARRCLRDV